MSSLNHYDRKLTPGVDAIVWEAIKYVGSGLSLLAFVVAVASVVYRQRILRDERLIKTAPESQRAVLVRNALEFFDVDTARLTKAQQYEIALEQIRSRSRRFQWTASIVIILALLLAIISGYAIYRELPGTGAQRVVPDVLAELNANRRLSDAVAEYRGSSVQQFERGWMVASFNENTFFAIGTTDRGNLRWFKKSDADFVKGLPIKGDGKPGDDKLILGFRWLYFDGGGNQGVRELLGRPVTGEIRAWLQFQTFDNGLVIYGIPSTVNDYKDGLFQVLSGAILYGESRGDSGLGKAVRLSEANVEGHVYCSANWYPAEKERTLPPTLKNLVTEGKCDSARGAEMFTSPHGQIFIK